MNTLVHIIRFCARESVAHAQKEHKVWPRFKCLKLVCTLLDLKLNQLNKICAYNMRQIKKLTGLQACFLGDVEVI